MTFYRRHARPAPIEQPDYRTAAAIAARTFSPSWHRALTVDAGGIHSDVPGASVRVEQNSDGTITITEVGPGGEELEQVQLPVSVAPPE